MNPPKNGPDLVSSAGADVQKESPARRWRPPVRSDQAPGEEVVQVNDAYAGGGPPPEQEPPSSGEQHQTGG
jgi:hypothetical protein